MVPHLPTTHNIEYIATHDVLCEPGFTVHINQECRVQCKQGGSARQWGMSDKFRCQSTGTFEPNLGSGSKLMSCTGPLDVKSTGVLDVLMAVLMVPISVVGSVFQLLVAVLDLLKGIVSLIIPF